jgi:hypothetical protein
MHQSKCGARDIARVAADRFGEAFDKAGLPRAHRAFQTENTLTAEASGQVIRGAAGICFRCAKAFPAGKVLPICGFAMCGGI